MARRNDGNEHSLRDLQWSEARWRAILGTARDAIISIDRKGHVTLFNRAAEQIFGYTAEEVLGKNVSVLMPSPYREEHDGYIEHYEETGEERAIGRIREVEGRRKNGEVFPIELSVSQATLGDDVVYVAILRDVTERRRIEDDLRRERDFAERLIETAQGIVLVLDPNGRIMRFNAYTEELTGYSAEEVRGLDWFERFLPAAERERARVIFLETMHVRGYVSTVILKDGTAREVEWHSRSLRDGSGKLIGVLSIGVDITDRLRAARRLTAQYAVSRTLAEARSLAEATPHMLQAIVEGIGYDLGELWLVDESDQQLHFAEAWHARSFDPGDLAAANRAMTFRRNEDLPGSVWASGHPQSVPDLESDKDFSRRTFVYAVGLRSGLAFPIRAGRVLGVIVLFQRERSEPDRELLRMLDAVGSQIGGFIERTRSDEAVRVSEARFFAFMDNNPAVAFIKDEDGRYVYLNTAFERAFRVDARDAVGKTDYDLWPPETARQLRANDQAVLAANRTVEMLESIPLPDGDVHQWMSFKFAIRDGAGKRSLAGIALDITDRLRAEAQLREAQRLAQQRERLADIGAITAKIAHDLGNPLGALSMQTQTMLRRAQRDPTAPAETMAQPLKQLSSEVRRLEALLRELMDFAREQRLDLRPVDPAAFLREIVDLWQPLANDQGIVLELEVGHDAEPFQADADQLRRVLDNLIKNALEALGSGPGRVTVRVKTFEKSTRITVEDTGPGIPENVKLFRLFETTKPAGSGLGLAVSKQIVQAHGGDILCERRLPSGTSFHVELPRLGPSSRDAIIS